MTTTQTAVRRTLPLPADARYRRGKEETPMAPKVDWYYQRKG